MLELSKCFEFIMNQMIRSSYRPPYFYINRGPYELVYEPFYAGFKEVVHKVVILKCKTKIYLVIFGLENKSPMFWILSQVTLKSKDRFVASMRQKT